MSLSLLAAFWSVATIFIITPGVDWAYAIAAGMRGKQYIPAVFGMAAGHLMATLLVATGLGIIIGQAPVVMRALALSGAAYLMWMGLAILRHPATRLTSLENEENSWSRWAIKGFMVSGLNPKVFLLFLALMPQFADRNSSWPLSLQFLTLGLIEVVTCCIVYLFIGYSSGAFLQKRPRAALIVSKTSGVLMIFIGTLIIADQFKEMFI